MNSSDELVKLIEAVVERKLNAARLNVQNITGGGGNTTVSSMGDVFLQPGVGKAAYYKGAEIGTGVDASDLTNYMRKDSAGGVQTQNNIILMENTLKMNSATQVWFNASNDNLAGKIYGTSVLSEGTNYYGVLITPTTGVTSGNFYIGEYLAAPAGDGIKITDQGILIYPAAGYDVSLGYAQLANFRLKNLATGSLPDGGIGGLAYDTTTTSVKVNKGAVGAPNWVEIGGGSGDVAANATRTLNVLTKWTNATTKEIGNSSITDDGSTVSVAENLNPSASDAKDLGTSSLFWRHVYTQDIYLDDASTYIANSAGSMQLHVAAGKTVDIVVG